MFEGKEITVGLKDNAEAQYIFLQNLVDEELDRGKINTDAQKPLGSINKTLAMLQIDPHAGTHITKRKIPKEYVKKYNAKNLWKCNLVQHWRILYLINVNDVEIVSFVLDILDHKKYNQKMSYHKN
jgi:hypothetical protein